MKMLNAGTANISDYATYSRNCNLGTCRRPYYAMVPSLSDVQLYLNLGTVKPSTIDFTIFNLCAPFDHATLNSDCFIIAFNGSYWYAVYKNFAGAAYSSYIIAASVSYIDESTQTFFSEQYMNASVCDTLTKVQVCYPYNWNAEDINSIYIGQPSISQPSSGKSTLFYHHIYWVKKAEIIETSNKITFTANLFKNFNTDLKKLYEFRPTDLIPGWYKDYLLAVYFRGNILINDAPAIVSDLNFENVNEAADEWKAYAVLSKEVKGSFGCSDITCNDDCICFPVTLPAITFADAMVSVPYSKVIPLGGSEPFTLSDIVKPGWMTTFEVVGSNLVIAGTPAEGDTEGSPVGFTVANSCSNASLSPTDGFINVDEYVAPDTIFAATTFVSGDALNTLQKANLSGAPGVTATVTLDAVVNTNGGHLKVNGLDAFVGYTWPVVLDGSGLGSLDVVINGNVNPSTVILGHFTITAVSSGAIGTPNTYQISKVF